MDKIFLFTLNHRTFGIELRYVKEVLEGGEIKAVPLAPSFISGLLNRRGRFLMIINLAELLRIPPGQENQDFRIIVLDHEEMDIGIQVNNIVGAKTVFVSGDGSKESEKTAGGSERGKFYQTVLKNVGNIDEVIILCLGEVFDFLWECKF